MKRLSFLAAIFGFGAAAKAQSKAKGNFIPSRTYVSQGGTFSGAPDVWTQDDQGNVFIGKGKPLNNQCPTCGAMAESYIRSQHYSLENCAPEKSDDASVACEVRQVPVGDTQRLARCASCNAAFFQDAET